MCKVSVIIPVYRVEKFIEHCARSLFEQTLHDVEFIFVDDATPDASIAILHTILAEYPNRAKQVKILVHEYNKGLPAARNTGLSVACGEYIFHCDSDDYVEPDMLETLTNYAEQQEADIVWCDWFLTFAQNERYMKQPSYDTPLDALKGMLSGSMKYNVWNKLVKRSLYVNNNICFPSGYNMGEDMTMILLFTYANRVAYVPKAYYHYVKSNSNAITKETSILKYDALRYNVQRISEFLKRKYGNILNQEIAFMQLEAKFPFLIVGLYKLWKEWYPEANQYIWKNKYVSFRSRCLQWLAWKNQFWAVKLYCRIVLGFIYGAIYR